MIGISGYKSIDTASTVPSDAVTALAFVVGFATMWTPGMSELNVPSGWTVVATDAYHEAAAANPSQGGATWWVLTTDTPLTAEHAWTWSDDTGDQSQCCIIVAYLMGCSGGSWGIQLGTPNYGSATSTPEQPPADAAIWLQLGMVASIWFGTWSPPSWTDNAGYVQAYCYPGGGVYRGEDFTTGWLNATPLADTLTWTSLGVYGIPGSQPLCVTWG